MLTRDARTSISNSMANTPPVTMVTSVAFTGVPVFSDTCGCFVFGPFQLDAHTTRLFFFSFANEDGSARCMSN